MNDLFASLFRDLFLWAGLPALGLLAVWRGAAGHVSELVGLLLAAVVSSALVFAPASVWSGVGHSASAAVDPVFSRFDEVPTERCNPELRKLDAYLQDNPWCRGDFGGGGDFSEPPPPPPWQRPECTTSYDDLPYWPGDLNQECTTTVEERNRWNAETARTLGERESTPQVSYEVNRNAAARLGVPFDECGASKTGEGDEPDQQVRERDEKQYEDQL